MTEQVEALGQELLTLMTLGPNSNPDPWHLVVARFILRRQAAMQQELDALRKVAEAAQAAKNAILTCQVSHPSLDGKLLISIERANALNAAIREWEKGRTP